MNGNDMPYQLKIAGMTLAGIFGAILFACICFTRPGPPPRDWANGIYANPCCANIVMQDGLLKAGPCEVRYKLTNQKFGIEADLPRWIGVRKGRVTCSNPSGMFMYFDGMSALDPPKAGRPPRYFTLYDDEHDGQGYIFKRL